MIEKKLWTCEYCKTDYAQKVEAQECEFNHKKKLKVVNTRYVSKKVDASGFPISITVEAEDGTKKTYKA